MYSEEGVFVKIPRSEELFSKISLIEASDTSLNANMVKFFGGKTNPSSMHASIFSYASLTDMYVY